MLVLLTLLACTGSEPESPTPPVGWTEEARSSAIAEGRAVLEKHQCRRCHELDDLPDPARPDHCTSCHVFIDGLKPEDELYQRIAGKYGHEVLERYQRNIVHLKTVPSLTGVGRRIRPDWIADFLASPTDLRPVLEESMIRTNLSPDERTAVARYFAAVADVPDPTGPQAGVPTAPDRPDAEQMAAAQALFKAKACATCHTVGNLDLGVTADQLMAARNVTALAPNLRFVRDRMTPETTVAWLLDPTSIKPDTTMPAMGLTREEAELLTAWLFHVDPELKPRPDVSIPPLPSTDGAPATWAEAKEQTLGDVCVHCHMNDHEKDPGPGNLGGLGYEGVGLSMRTYEALVAGYGGTNALQSDTATPPLLDVMLRRRAENLRDLVPPFEDHVRPPYPEGPLGMPMGLPALDDAEIAAVAAWIDAGCPGPTEVTGTPGVDDGFLVPDGPLQDNHGCGLRAPSTTRPAWAVAPPKGGRSEP